MEKKSQKTTQARLIYRSNGQEEEDMATFAVSARYQTGGGPSKTNTVSGC